MQRKITVKPAPVWRRIVAFIIDICFFMFVINRPFLIAYFSIMGVSTEQITLSYFMADSQIGKYMLVSTFISSILMLVYFSATESVLGATLGKYLTGIKVISITGSNASIIQALVRNIPKTLIPLFAIDMIGIFGRERQRFSEKLAGTYVVNIKGVKNE